MYNLRTIVAVLRHDLRKLLFSWRTLIVFLAITGLIVLDSREIRMLCELYGIRVPILPLFVALTETPYTSSILLVGWLVIMCDAPFVDACQPMILLRCGRLRWSIGQMGYILIASILYWAYIFVVTVLVLVPYGEFSGEWGQVYTSLAVTHEARALTFSLDLMDTYPAIQVFFQNYTLNMLLSMVMAQVMYTINMVTSSIYGIIIPSITLMMHYFYLSWFLPTRYLFFSPVSFVKTSMRMASGSPSTSYAVIVLVILWCLTLGSSIAVIRHRTIQVQKPI